MAVNPDYALLLAQIAAETDPVIKAQLEAQCYVFQAELTDPEIELFEYCAFDYIENNPGYVNNVQDVGLYVPANYVAEGYINTVEADVGLYMADGYAVSDYVSTGAESGDGFISYVGIYYNDNGERTT